MKSEAIKELEKLMFDHKRMKFPNMPSYAIVKPKYSDKTANGLTACIVDYLNSLDNTAAWRVNNMGVWDSKRKSYRTSNTRKGVADITAIKNGRCYQIEVKVGKDKMSKEQISFQSFTEEAKGIYIVAHSFTQFKNLWISQ